MTIRGIIVVFVVTVVVVAANDWNEDVLENESSVVKRETCRDKHVVCKRFVHLCGQNNWVKQNCPLSCKLCSKCNDKFSSCSKYQRYCKTSSDIRNNCPNTCDLCGSKPQRSTTPRPTTEPTKSSILPCNRQIEKPSCTEWKRRGYCSTKSKFFPYMRRECPGACRLCRLPIITTRSPVITNGAHSVTVNINECLRAHNVYRARHGSPPLTWDLNMARQAQAYALKLAKMKQIKHASGIPHGENLAMRRGRSNAKYSCEQATKAWYDEVKDYSYSSPGFSMATGHFTQVVWKQTKRLGVGIAKNGDFTIVVARYDPSGNYRGQFRENVLPARRG